MTLKVLENRITEPMLFEVVRDRIAEILVNELANQEALALAASADQTPYQIAISTEKTDPWESTQFPLVNVWYDTGNIDTGASSPANNQQGDHFYNLDCYVEKDSEVSGSSIVSGDTLSAREVQRVAGLVWQIIMADQNTRLQFPFRTAGVPSAVVAHRVFEQLSTFQPSFGDKVVQNVEAMRLSLNVRHVEIPPVSLGVTLHAGVFVVERTDTTKDVDDQGVDVDLT